MRYIKLTQKKGNDVQEIMSWDKFYNTFLKTYLLNLPPENENTFFQAMKTGPWSVNSKTSKNLSYTKTNYVV
jgi:hypothetical protein